MLRCSIFVLFPLALSAANPALEKQFQQTVRPILAKYCNGCHTGDTPAAEFDLKPYSTVESVLRDHPRWHLVSERMMAKEMPPKQMPQPSDEARKQVTDWIHAVRMDEAGLIGGVDGKFASGTKPAAPPAIPAQF